MRKLILALAFLLAGAVNAFGQSTTVSGTVTDAGSQAWAGGTYKFTFTPNSQFPTGPYTWTGGALNQVISGVLDGSGAYSVSIPSNTAISPQGSKWILQVTPNATSSSFSTPPTTITGGTQTLNVTPPAIVVVATVVSRAYADAEVSAGAIIGSEYFNVTTSLVRVCTAVTGQSCTTWANVGSGAGGGITGSGVANQVAFFTAPTVIGGNVNLTFDPTTGSFNAQGTGAFQGLSSGPALNNFVSVTPTAISLAANESGATGTFSSDGTFSINSNTGNVAISAPAGLINFGSGGAAHLTDAGALTVTSCTGCGGSSGTVTNIATQGPLFGGPITTTGTIGIGFPDRSVAGTTDTIVSADRGGRVVYTNVGAVAVTLPQEGSAGFTNNFYYDTANEGLGGVVTITPTISTVNGNATLVLQTGQSCKIGPNSTGTSYAAECSESQITAGTNLSLTRAVHGLTINSLAGAFPVTVTGGVSGAIPYFSSTTTESVSALLTANALVKGGGAGVAPSSSSVTDDGTTITLPEIATFSKAGAASVASVNFTGTVFAGGSATTTFPNIYLNYGTAPTTWQTTGTLLGINAPSAFGGFFTDYHLNGGGSVFSVASTGAITTASNVTGLTITGNQLTSTGNITAAGTGIIQFSARSRAVSAADGRLTLSTSTNTLLTRLTFGAETTSFPAFTMSGTGISTTLGDGTAGGTLTAGNIAAMQSCGTTSTCSATAIATGARIVYGSAPLVSGTPSTVTISGISPAFTSNTSYKCTMSDQTGVATALFSITYVSGSSFTITGGTALTDTVGYICAGN